MSASKFPGKSRLVVALGVVLAAQPIAGIAQTTPAPVTSPTAPGAPLPTPSSGVSSAPIASPAPTASGSPAADAASIDPAIVARSRDWLHRIQTAKIDRTQLDATMNSVLTDAVAAQAAKQFAPLGDPTSFTFVDKRRISTNTVYRFRVVFASATLAWFFAVDDTGKISGLRFAPPQ